MLLDLLSGHAMSEEVSVDFLLGEICSLCSGSTEDLSTLSRTLGQVIVDLIRMCLSHEPT